jgi:hypothetical protein
LFHRDGLGIGGVAKDTSDWMYRIADGRRANRTDRVVEREMKRIAMDCSDDDTTEELCMLQWSIDK